MAVHGLSLTQPLSSDLTTWTASISSHLDKQNEQPSATSSAASDKQQSNSVGPKLTAGSTDLDATKIHKITMGVTAYGTPEEVHQYDQLIQRHITSFTDDGKTANIPEDQWLTVPLVSDWRTSGAKLAHKVYPLGQKEQQLVDEVFDKLHQQNRMEWSKEPTPFGFPVFVIWKTSQGSDGQLIRKGRAVVDIRGLNKITVTDAYPIPNQADIIAAVAGCNYITVIDALSFFYQFPVAKEDRHKFTVVSHRGMERFRVAVMGFKNTPPYAQRIIENITRRYRHFIRIYIDDMIIFSKTFTEHLEHLETIFSLFDHFNFTLSPSKSFLGFPTITILGQRVDGFGVSTGQDKIDAIKTLEFPDTLKALERYLGLTGWLRKYIANYAIISEPLQRQKTLALKKAPSNAGNLRNHFCKTTSIPKSEENFEAYQRIQQAFQQPTFLVHFDPTRQLYIDVDISKRGIGAMVYHVIGDPTDNIQDIKHNSIQPIMFLSRVLTPAEQRFWPTEMEVAGLVWVVSKLRHLIQSTQRRPAIIITDHAAATFISKQTSLTSTSPTRMNQRLVRASMYLSLFDLDIRYKPGKAHTVPDALSRLSRHNNDPPKSGLDELLEERVDAQLDSSPILTHHTTLVEMSAHFKELLKQGYETDKHWSKQDFQEDAPPGIQFVKRDGLFYHIDSMDGRLRLCIPRSLEGEIFGMAHEPQHFGFHRTYDRIKATYYVRKLAKRLRLYLDHCQLCKLAQTKHHPPFGQLRPIQSPPIPFHTVTIDLIVGLPKPPGTEWDALMTITCKASKKITGVPGQTTYSAEDWAEAFLNATADWGIPKAIISDRDRKFVSDLWTSIFKRLGTELLVTTAYHPQSDGQSERTNQTIEIALRFWTSQGHLDWHKILPHLFAALNNSKNASTGLTPNEYVYGFNTNEGLSLVRQDDQTPEDLTAKRQVFRQEAADALAWANICMKRHFDSKHLPVTYKPGQFAYVRLHQGYSVPSIVKSPKFQLQRLGPFPILEVLGKGNACRLDLPTTWRIHPVISIDQLEPAPEADKPDPFNRPQNDQPAAIDENDGQFLVERLLDRRIRRVGRYRKEVTEYLVKWSGYGHEHNQWVKEDDVSEDLKIEYKQTHGDEGVNSSGR